MNILLIYYHPVVWDLAESFTKLGHNITVAVNLDIKDNYGTGASILKAAPPFLKTVPLSAALLLLKQKQFDLMGCDGVFSGDELAIKTCQDNIIPYFCINGYPHNLDEPSNNILSFSWFLPQIRYKMQFQNEWDIKERDWKAISESGESGLTKNILVFYPELSYAKKMQVQSAGVRDGFTSLIHRYKECNIHCHSVFEKVQQNMSEIRVSNVEGKHPSVALAVLSVSEGLLHLKHGDCPGISVLEAMMVGTPVYTMRSFVLASFNQEVLIDGYTAIIADNVDELIRRMKEGYDPYVARVGREHILELTSLERQKNKLNAFLEKCLKNV